MAVAPRFEVELGGSIVATFSECSGLGVTIQTEKLEEGGVNHTTRKLPGRTDFTNIVLKHGITHSTDLFDWLMRVMNGEKARQNVSIRVFGWEPSGSALAEMVSWQFSNAFPVKWTGPQLQATGNAIAVETLELAHDGFV
ncbi:MAG: phage tail protein [Dehalococcoidia bacterium]|nr:phage tail protein [Dehalococcoidia bacterium]